MAGARRVVRPAEVLAQEVRRLLVNPTGDAEQVVGLAMARVTGGNSGRGRQFGFPVDMHDR